MKRLFLAGVALCFSYLSFSQTTAGNALAFNGASNVGVSDNAGLDLQDSYTIEAWVRATSLSADRTIISKGNQYAIKLVAGGGLYFYSSEMGPISSGATLQSNAWSHIAVTFDISADQVRFYLNGSLITTVSGVLNTQSDYSQLYIGAGDGQSDPMIGYLDEVRIWNKVLTPAEIKIGMITEIKPSNANYAFLVAYWKFNEASGAMAADVKGNNDGTVNGTAWVASGAIMIDVSITDYSMLSGVSNGSSLSMGHAVATMSGGNAATMIIYKPLGLIVTANAPLVGVLPASAFGVKLFGSVGGTYQVVYDYSAHSGINDETKLRLASRPDNVSLWSTTAATQDMGAHTFTLGGQTGTEFSLGTIAGGNVLPVSLLSFKATALKSGGVQLQWQTASESNNDFFSVMRSKDAVGWEQAVRVAGAGNSTSLKSYEATDGNPHPGVSFYRLKQTDFNGRTTYSQTVKLTVKKEILIKVDATHHRVIITGLALSEKDFNVYSLSGQSLTGQAIVVSATSGGLVLDVSALPSQIYIFVTESGEAKKFRL
jgi:hypothetical protein